jgi:hypothetical protein
VEDWFALNFGSPRQLSSVRLYFYADGTKFKAPRKYTLQYSAEDGSWRDIPNDQKTPARPLANGENTVTFNPLRTTKLRIVFKNPDSAAIALVECEAFE